MEYINLGNSDLKVSRLCMGGCPMGQYGWGKVSRDDLIEAVRTAVDKGLNFFDTADTYGLGEAERTLSEALGENRSKVVIGTKFGVRVENGKTFYDNSPDWINKACEESLKRLNSDYIDLYQIHYRDGKTPLSAVVEALDRLKEKGYIRAYGLSNITAEDLDEIKDFKDKFVSFQDEYSLACRKNESHFNEIVKETGMTPLTWGSLGQGILTGKYDKNATFGKDDRRSRDIYVNFHGEKLLKNLEIVDEMRKISERIDKPVSAIAIRFILDFLKGSVVIAGIKNPSQLLSNMAAMDWNLGKEDILALENISREGSVV